MLPKKNAENQSIIVHNSLGLKFCDGPPNLKDNSSNFQDIQTKIKFLQVSQNGNCLAWIANGEVCVVAGPEWKRIGTLQHPKAAEITFSPSGNMLAVWDMFFQTKGEAPVPNLSIYDVTERKLLKTFVQKSHEGWQPQWSKDEVIMARMIADTVHFYEGKDLDTYKHKKVFQKLRSYNLSPSAARYHIMFFIPSLKGAPATLQLFKYSNFKDNSDIVASKSFYKVDSVETFWNEACTCVLVLATSEVDKSGGSYYGEQKLFFFNTKGVSNLVTFSKEGSIRSVAWCSPGKEFFCVYGHAPARATLFNLKCDPVTEFGDGARNLVIPNPQGNLVLLGAMGNISSRFEIFDVSASKLLGKQECPDITCMEWSPCGQYILTSTCSPRLRVNNGFKVWHYSTALMHEYLSEGTEELYLAKWLPDPCASSTTFEVSSKPVKGIQTQQKQAAAATERYIPPSQRKAAGSAGLTVDTTKKFLSERENLQPTIEDKKDKKILEKRRLRKEKREEAMKKKKEEEKGMNKNWREDRELVSEKQPKGKEKKKENATKRIKNIKKKLESIESLKATKERGDILDVGQLDKISSEEALLSELKDLSVT